MPAFAQTDPQLYQQFVDADYPETALRQTALRRIRSACDLATILFSRRFRPDGKPFLARLAGTASILGGLRAPIENIGPGSNAAERGETPLAAVEFRPVRAPGHWPGLFMNARSDGVEMRADSGRTDRGARRRSRLWIDEPAGARRNQTKCRWHFVPSSRRPEMAAPEFAAKRDRVATNTARSGGRICVRSRGFTKSPG